MNKFEILDKLHIRPEMRLRVETVVLECLTKAQAKYGEDKIKVIPEIVYKTKGRAAGLAGYNCLENRIWIDINPVLLNENPDEVLKQVIPHEVAHCIIYMLYPGELKAAVTPWGIRATSFRVEPHGYEWQSVMRVFGLDPHRCHRMDTSTVKAIRNGGQEFHYKCLCGIPHKLGIIKHNRISVHGKNYTCNRCRAIIRFDKVVEI